MTAEPRGDLAGRVALVTGASSGIGRACALRLAAAGAHVAVNYYNSDAGASEVVAQIAANGGRAAAFQADVGIETQVADMFTAITSSLGPPRVLVNNAGIQRDAKLVDMSMDAWDAVIRTNLTGQFLCARAFMRSLASRDHATHRQAGNIVFISSVHDRIPWGGHANYAASKGGLDMLMRSLALEVAPLNVRVNAVAPGAIRTEINRDMWESEAGRKDVLEKIPVKRIGDPEDVAQAVCWLASDASGYVHGHTLYVDGGMTLYPSFVEGG